MSNESTLAKQILLRLNTSQYLNFTDKEIEIVKNLKNVFTNNLTTLDSKFINQKEYTHEELKKWNGLDYNRIKSISAEISNNNFMYEMFDTASTKNSVPFPSPFSNKILNTNTSFTAMNTVFLRFFDQNEVFYLSQHYNFVDTLYFPNRDLIISFDGGGNAWSNEVKHFGHMISFSFKDYINIVNDKEKSFGGIIISDDSPYHFFYNHMFCSELLYKKKILHKVKKVYSIVKEWYYFDLNKLYNDCEFTFEVLTNTHINAIPQIAKNKEFYLNAVLLLKHISVEDRNESFRRIVATAPSLLDHEFKYVIETVKKRSPLIWLGITGQKRSWLEQEEGYAKIIDNLYKQYPNLGVIIDGWTTGKYDPEYCEQNENIQKDLKVVNNIIQKINKNITVINTVGRSSIDKIAIGKEIDFFIVNNGTGSMYVDAICMKQGITHTSNRFRNSSNSCHIHNNDNLVPIDKVIDMETDSDFSHVGDYSINWEDIETLIKSLDINVKT